MRILRAAPLLVAVLLTVLFFIYYAKTVRWCLDGGLEDFGRSFLAVCYDLRDSIQVVVWKPIFPQSQTWVHSGWDLFRYTDTPEGTRPIINFPSWYLLMPLAVLWIYGVFAICRNKHATAEPRLKPK